MRKRKQGNCGRRLTSSEYLEVRQHIAAGETHASAAAAVGCSTQTVRFCSARPSSACSASAGRPSRSPLPRARLSG